MFDLKFSFWLILVDIVLYFSGILFWFSSNFTNSLGVEGFFPRFFAGTVSIILGLIVTFIMVRNG